MIGFGSFGSVYKGKIKGVNVAIKIINQNVHDTNNLKNFLKELDVISEIKYERFLKLLGICLDPNSPFCIITDLMNLSLYDLLYSQLNEPINYFKKLDIALQLAEGIQYLHQHKIIHRDLKPENILLDQHHNIKICDFGMSRFIGENQNSAYFTSQMMGTSNYMAPEYFRSSGIGTAVDI